MNRLLDPRESIGSWVGDNGERLVVVEVVVTLEKLQLAIVMLVES